MKNRYYISANGYSHVFVYEDESRYLLALKNFDDKKIDTISGKFKDLTQPYILIG